MLAVIRGLDLLREHWESDERETLAVLLNAVSLAEANLALSLLIETVPQRVLVTAVNLREALATLPACPHAMALEMTSLAQVCGMEKDKACYVRGYEDPEGDFELVVTGDGNLCYDILIRSEGSSAYWTPSRREQDYVTGEALDLVLARRTLLERMVDLAQSMGAVYSPRFYMSLDDWRMEYAEDAMDDLRGMF